MINLLCRSSKWRSNVGDIGQDEGARHQGVDGQHIRAPDPGCHWGHHRGLARHVLHPRVRAVHQADRRAGDRGMSTARSGQCGHRQQGDVWREDWPQVWVGTRRSAGYHSVRFIENPWHPATSYYILGSAWAECTDIISTNMIQNLFCLLWMVFTKIYPQSLYHYRNLLCKCKTFCTS